MKLKKFESLELKKSSMISSKGGTSTTIYQEVGVWENEYEDTNGNGQLDEEEAKNQKPKLVNFPDF